MLTDERLDEFRTNKEALILDVREALLGRLTPPTQRRAEQAATDPQVQQALELAANEAEYARLLRPAPSSAPAVTVPPIANGATLTILQAGSGQQLGFRRNGRAP